MGHIADNVEFESYSNFSRVLNPGMNNRNMFMKGIISLLVPANISEICLYALIEFRNKNREIIKAFNNQIDLLEDSIEMAIMKNNLLIVLILYILN